MCIDNNRLIVIIAIDRKSFILYLICKYKSIVLIYMYGYNGFPVVLSTHFIKKMLYLPHYEEKDSFNPW